MATYALTVSTNALGLGVINGATVRVEKRRVAIADTYPPINNLIQISEATNSSGIATFLLEPDDLTTYHVAKIFDSAGIPVYEKSFTMTPSSLNLHESSISTVIGGSLIQFKKNGNNLGTPTSVRNVDIVISESDTTFAGDTVTINVASALALKVSNSAIGTPSGVAPLDGNGKVPDQYLSFVQAGTNAVAQTVQRKLSESVSVLDFIPVEQHAAIRAYTSNYDCTAEIQAAINVSYGRTLKFPAGQYYINTVTDNSLLSIRGSIKISAEGAYLRYGMAANSSTDVIRVYPQTLADEGLEIEGLWIFEKEGSPARDVIRINLDATHGLKKLRLSKCLFRSKTGYAVSCFNPGYLNTNGLFLTDINLCEFVGGFYSDGHGDTTRIANSAFTGQNRGIEIEMLPISAGGGASSCLSITNNNITSTGGAIFIRNGRNMLIEGNNIEQLTDFSGNYCIQLNYADHNADHYVAGVSWVRGNKIEPNDPGAKCGGLGMFRCMGTMVEGNEIGTSAKTAGVTISVAMTECSDINIFYNDLYITDNCWGVYVSSGCTNVSYKPGKITNFNQNYIEILDEGVGTKGVFKTPTFENSWTNASNTAYQVARFVKRDEGDVLLEGVLASGTLTNDTPMFTLPLGFRPAKRLTFIAPCFTSGGVHGQAVVRIDPDGIVRMRNASTGDSQLLELSLCGIKFSALSA